MVGAPPFRRGRKEGAAISDLSASRALFRENLKKNKRGKIERRYRAGSKMRSEMS